jgi:hypothetical protein
MPCHPHQLTRPHPAMPGTTSAVLQEVAGEGAMVRREATSGIAADNLLTGPAPPAQDREAALKGSGCPIWVAGIQRTKSCVRSTDLGGLWLMRWCHIGGWQRRLRCFALPKVSEVVEQQSMHEDVPTANLP